ncbi:MAG: efflux RND transporter periplasmic adaptor subunit [Deltaproteobacteria bacterium]|nr:efflux RND transporter periplasmic adaptor subunit [Deltaproteobacteria bacterium]
MKRVAIAFTVLVLGLGALLGVRLRSQAQALRGPAGGSGEIEGTPIDLGSRVGARIERIHVRKGDAVKKGDLLVTFDCADAQAAVAEIEARLRAAEAQARAAELSTGAARGSRQVAASAKAAALAQAASLAAQRDAALRQSQRLEAVAKDVALSSRDQTRSSAEALEQQVRAMRAQATASQEQMVSAGATWRASTAQAQAAEEQAQAVAATLRRARLLAADCELRAPRDAYVAELPHEEGELLAPGAIAIRLLDLRELRATFYLPNAELALVKPGAPAEVKADAYPGERFGGRVSVVALRAEFTPRNIQTRSDRDRLVYPIEVIVANRDGKLRAGMPVDIALPGTARP